MFLKRCVSFGVALAFFGRLLLRRPEQHAHHAPHPARSHGLERPSHGRPDHPGGHRRSGVERHAAANLGCRHPPARPPRRADAAVRKPAAIPGHRHRQCAVRKSLRLHYQYLRDLHRLLRSRSRQQPVARRWQPVGHPVRGGHHQQRRARCPGQVHCCAAQPRSAQASAGPYPNPNYCPPPVGKTACAPIGSRWSGSASSARPATPAAAPRSASPTPVSSSGPISTMATITCSGQFRRRSRAGEWQTQLLRDRPAE